MARAQFVVILGIHNWVRWCNKVIGLAPADTGTKILNWMVPIAGAARRCCGAIRAKGTALEYSVDGMYVKQSGNSLFVNPFIAS